MNCIKKSFSLFSLLIFLFLCGGCSISSDTNASSKSMAFSAAPYSDMENPSSDNGKSSMESLSGSFDDFEAPTYYLYQGGGFLVADDQLVQNTEKGILLPDGRLVTKEGVLLPDGTLLSDEDLTFYRYGPNKQATVLTLSDGTQIIDNFGGEQAYPPVPTSPPSSSDPNL
ncbi:hypothetical protein [Neglectibacter caecimuris]|uniref:hypothetical protein n=1 Tax=Neglectibacter caecimuris TaxID=3093658 RepID=UPI002AC9EE8D|nr:hypothetical protein [Neglectibacter sp. M00184]